MKKQQFSPLRPFALSSLRAFALLCFLLSVFFLKAQEIQFPDPGFETKWQWTTSPVGDPYYEYDDEYFFYTLNSLRKLEGGSEITAFRDENAHGGNYCMKLVSGRVPVGTSYVFLPGMVGTLNPEFVKEFLESDSNSVTMCRFWDNDTPSALEGWFKYHPAEGDSALIDIGFYNHPDEDPVFVAQKVVYQKVNNWTPFQIVIPEQYRNKYYNYIRVLFVASAGVNFNNLMGCTGQRGSTLWIDDIYLNYKELGIKQNLLSTLKAKAFPNPATEVLNIELNEHFAGNISVYNISGSLVMEENVNGTECQLNIAALAAGNYAYKLMNGNTIFAQGKFVVTK
jgi:hypothetical protein